MHPSVMAWVGATLTRADIAGRHVLEVGACDVNGSVRPFVERLRPASYLGVDSAPGPRVDRVMPAEDLPAQFPHGFDVVISTEMMEHAQDWRACMQAIAQMVRPGGLLVLTTRAPGFPYHPFPGDYWRYTVPLMRRILVAVGFGSLQLCADPDPNSPGVFALARKSSPWTHTPGVLDDIDVPAVVV